MGKIVDGDDGLPAEGDVGPWAREKHKLLRDYVQISSATRRKYLPPPATKGGATLIDLFCGPGRVQFEDTGEFEDGGCVAAWRQSVEAGTPFSRVIIGDMDGDKVEAARIRLERLGANVEAFVGPARDTCVPAVQHAGSLGLHFAFLDPYSLGALDFTILKTLAKLKRIDMLVHVSQMDLQRNFDRNSTKDASALDIFAPGWREGADTNRGKKAARQAYFDYWKDLVAGTGIATAPEVRLVTGPGKQPLYLLMLATRHDLALKFWSIVSKKEDPQLTLL